MTTVEDRATGERVQTCECETCHYCGTYVAARHEHDHFPVPKSAGGTNVVPACMNCHEIKDRTPLHKWPVNLVGAGYIELSAAIVGVPEFELISPSGMVRHIGDYRIHWQRWSMAGRLFYAKSAFLAAMEEDRKAKQVAARWL